MTQVRGVFLFLVRATLTNSCFPLALATSSILDRSVALILGFLLVILGLAFTLGLAFA